MRSTSYLLYMALCVRALPGSPDSPPPSLPGTFVPYSEMYRCPKLIRRPEPMSARDVRPDDFTVVMALGDSITAGLLAKSSQEETEGRAQRKEQVAMSSRPIFTLPFALEEYRGVSYAIGGDLEATTIPNILSYYVPNVTGFSTGHHVPVSCLGSLCTPHPESDNLNAAVSGSISANLLAQARDYLVPVYQNMGKTDGWAYLNIGIGANDICAFCMTPNVTALPVGTPEDFARGIKDAVDLMRLHVPKLIVNIVGLFRVSAIYKLTLNDPYCQSPLLPPILPHLPLECSCAFLPGPAGDYTRSKMDDLSDEYDSAVLRMIKEWDTEEDPSFAAIWQPGTALDLANYPISAVSPIDCFHPSEAAHRRMAAGIWNRLTLTLADKAIPIKWERDIYIRCLEEEDRIKVNQFSQTQD